LWVEGVEIGKYTNGDWREFPRPDNAPTGEGIWFPYYITYNDYLELLREIRALEAKVAKLSEK
jgi:hypothetical protein